MIRASLGRSSTPPAAFGWNHYVFVTLVALLVVLAGCSGGDTEQGVQSEGDPGTEGTGTGTEEVDTDTDGEDELTSIDVAFVPATTGLLLNVAEAEGLFEDHGLDAELSEAQNISEIIPTLGQQFDISLGTTTDLIRAGESGLDVVQISGNTISTEDNPFAQLIVEADSGIEDITDLEGRRMASPTLSGVINMAVLYWAQQEGIEPDSIDGVQVPPPNHPDQLNAGQVDAVQALEPFASQLLGQGHQSLGNPFAAIKLPLATNFWVANGQWADDNPEVVDGFTSALEDAKDFLEDSEANEARAREVLQEYTGMPPEAAENVALPTFDLEVRQDDVDTWIDVLEQLGELDGDIDSQGLVR